MFNRPSFEIYSWQQSPEKFYGTVVITPVMQNSHDYAHRIFTERGANVLPYSLWGERYKIIQRGIPLSKLIISSSKREIEMFLTGIIKWGYYDFKSISAIDMDEDRFFLEPYISWLKEIEKSQSLRCSVSDFFGSSP